MSNKSKEMFNPDQKNKYITYSLLTANTYAEDMYRRSLVNFFKRLGVLEEKYGKDFANFSFEDMKQMSNELFNGAVGYQKNILSHLTQYVSWAIENGKSNLKLNPLLGLKTEDLNLSVSYATTMLSTLGDLIAYLDKILAPMEDDTIDNQYRVFCMLLFEGLTVEEIIYLKEDDIDKTKGEIKLKSKLITLSKETRNVICLVLLQLSIRSAIKEGTFKEFRITKVGYLLENSRPAEEKQDENYRQRYYNSFKVGLSRRLSEGANNFKPTKKLTPKKIFLSGIFSRIYEQECRGEELSYSEYFEFKKNNVRTVLSPGLVKKEAIEEYKIWKDSFSL